MSLPIFHCPQQGTQPIPKVEAGNYTPPQGEREGSEHLLENVLIYHYYGVESTKGRFTYSKFSWEWALRRQIRVIMEHPKCQRVWTWSYKLHGVTDVSNVKPESHPFCPISLELLC